MQRFTRKTYSFEFVRLDNEQDICAFNLDAFAAAFNHVVPRLFPIWVALLDDQLVAYSHTHTHVIAYPAVAPGITPRAFYDLSWQWFTKLKMQYGDPLTIAPPGFTDNMLIKVGLEPFSNKLYKIMD